MKPIKRHFDPGPTNRNRREGYRIDHTSVDGSGLTQDDGNQMHEPQMDDLAPTTANVDPLRGRK
jgi:hypothetical protein